MYIPCESSSEIQIDTVAHMVPSSKSGEAIREDNLMEACLIQKWHAKSLIIETKAKMANALSTRKEASRNKFVSFVAYFMI